MPMAGKKAQKRLARESERGAISQALRKVPGSKVAHQA
uniref:Uncharacterized protein n=1 Tax=Anguilla anguilla TaxID=7936 RepID=A0A0E9W834_ANGAN